MSASPCAASLRRPSITTPRCESPSHATCAPARSRSPTPPVNTSVSRPRGWRPSRRSRRAGDARRRRARDAPRASSRASSSRMSDVPASPTSPDSCSSASAISLRGMPACSCSHSSRPGSTEPERVAITRPSSGVKPIVVSTERPSSTAHRDAPAPRWQVTIRLSVRARARRRAPPRRRARARGSRTGARRSAPAIHGGARRWPRRGGSEAWKAVSKHATSGTSGSASETASTAAK